MTSLRHALAAELRDRINGGEWDPGDRLPSEPELARRRDVSRSSIRAALTVLERQGYVSRRKGSGTYVTAESASARDWGGAGRWTRLGDDARRRDWVVEPPGAAPAPPTVADVLGVPPGTAVGRRQRSQIGAATAVDWWRLDDMRVDELATAGITSVSAALATRGFAVGRSVVKVTPQNADEELARRLEVPRGTLLLDVEQIGETASGTAVLFSRAQRVAEGFTFTVLPDTGPVAVPADF